MRDKFLYAVIACLAGLLVFQVVDRFKPADRPVRAVGSAIAVGDTLPDLTIATVASSGVRGRAPLGSSLQGDCTTIIVIDSDCKGCRLALDEWAKDTSWGDIKGGLSWMLLRETDTAAARKVFSMDPDARVTGLVQLEDLTQLGVTMWPSAVVLDAQRQVLARPAPFPADIRLALAGRCQAGQLTASPVGTGRSPT